MYTPDPHMAHVVAAAKEKLQDQLIYLENALKEKGNTRTTLIYGMSFYIIGESLHFTDESDRDLEINAVTLLNSAGIDSVQRNDISQAIMSWFTNPTYQSNAMKLHTNMLAGISDKPVILAQLQKPHVTHDHTWINLNGEYKVLIVRLDMTESGATDFLLEIWRVNVENPNIGYQHFDRHVGAPNTELRLEPIGGWLYPDRSALMTDLCHFIDANVHNS